MKQRYIPQVEQASVPIEGIWSETETEPILALSLPEWHDVMAEDVEGFQYVWMYDRSEEAYLFCFRLQNGVERAIAFPRDHAGKLLQDEKANQLFTMMVTKSSLQDLDSAESCLLLPTLRWIRHPKADW